MGVSYSERETGSSDEGGKSTRIETGREPEERGRVSGPINSAYIESIHGNRIINKTVCINK